MRIRKCFQINKKGISPLIATVLLIGFTVALAGVVITWGGGFIKNITTGTEERTASTLACASDLNFEIKKVNCDSDEITIDNRGDIALEEIRFRFFDNSGDTKDLIPEQDPSKFNVGAFAVKKDKLKDVTGVELTIPASTVKVEAVATIKVNDQKIICGDAIRSKSFSLAC